MNERLINLLKQNRVQKLRGKEEEERRYHQVPLSMKNYLRRSSSQIHCGNVTIWPNHRRLRNVQIGFNAIYAMNISAQRAMTRDRQTETETETDRDRERQKETERAFRK